MGSLKQADGEDFDGSEPRVTYQQRPKDPRSRAKYNIISRLFFIWADSLFRLGCSRNLDQADLFAHPEEVDSERLLKTFNRHWKTELERANHGRNPRLWMALLKVLWWRSLIQGIVYSGEVAVVTIQSILVGILSVHFTKENPSPEDTRNAYLIATGFALLVIPFALTHTHGILAGLKLGMMSRIVMTGAIYQKVLRFNQVTIGKLSIGHIINLASNDVQRMDLGIIYIHFLWLTPLLVAVITWLVYVSGVGNPAFLVLGFVLLQIPLQLFMSRIFALLRFKSAILTDQRVRVMNEIISGIRVIKMYAWEHALERVLAKIRRKESRLILYSGIIRGGVYGFFAVSSTILGYFVFITLVTTNGEQSLVYENLFVTISLLITLRLFVAECTVLCLQGGAEALVALSRIQKLLMMDEVSSPAIEYPATNEAGSFSLSASIPITESSASQVALTHYLKKGPPSAEQAKSPPAVLPSYLKHTASSKKDVRLSTNLSVNTGYFRPASPYLQGSRQAPTHKPTTPLVRMFGLSASWSYDRKKMVLKDINFEISRDKCVMAVIGAVGAGKSTLLQCLLGELKAMDGFVDVKGRISYASQEAWIFSGTIRDNILFGLPYEKSWYETVLEACTLDKDVDQLESGDLTLVGERGVTLSGGQKARVSLARAVYRNTEVYLLDDPLSAVDAAVARDLFDKCIRGLLKDRVVILITHQLQFALEADKILALKEGQVEVYGTNAELKEKGIDPTELLKLIKTEDDFENDEFAYSDADSDDSLTPAAKSPTRRHVSPYMIRKYIGEEASSLYAVPSMLSLHSAVEVATSRNEEERLQGFDPLVEEKEAGTITLKTYFHFFRAGGNYLVLGFVFFVFMVAEAGIVMSDWWLAQWATCNVNANQSLSSTESSGSNCNESVQMDPICTVSYEARIGIYTGLVTAALLLNIAKGVLFSYVIVNASRVLHNRMLSSILRAPVLFFDNNPVGRVLNRFAKDVGFLDDLLPYIFLEYLLLAVRFLFYISLTIATVWYIIFPVIALVVAFIVLRWYYLKTSREVKRLEANARSPLYSHISTTLQGLSTIRCFDMQNTSMEQFHRYQNQHSQGWYLYLLTTRWFGVRVDALISTLIPILAFALVALFSSAQSDCGTGPFDPGLIGLALTYTVALATIFQWCIQQSAEVENIMVSVERILQYSRLESEPPLETLLPSDKPPANWPDKGQINMDNVCFQYSSDLPLVLKDLTFSVQPSEKIGIVGRTGAGKSSLLSVLFRLAEPFGSITIDGVETKSLGLHDLRKKISIIPQDPVLFSGTMRYNLDPFDDYSDAELWDVLEQVQLKEVVEQLEGRLEGEVSEGGSNFSVGQRQLVCLARALLKKNKILVLDEATANVDVKTDSIIQGALRENFADCTVLTIAHRLNTIMDSDRVLVMNKGQVKEFDRPYRLLENPDSQFYKMVEKTGPTASQKLHDMANEAHMRRRASTRRRSKRSRASETRVHFK